MLSIGKFVGDTTYEIVYDNIHKQNSAILTVNAFKTDTDRYFMVSCQPLQKLLPRAPLLAVL
jgi:hypothetical protein